MLDTEGLLSGSEKRPLPTLDKEDLLSSSAQRASSQAQHRGPPLGLGRVGLLSGSAEGLLSDLASQALRLDTGPPLRLDTEALLPGSSHNASFQAL